MNAAVQALPEGALRVLGGRVAAVGPPLVRGAFQLFEVSIQLAAPNTPCNIWVPAGALTGGGSGCATGATAWNATQPEPCSLDAHALHAGLGC